MPWRPKDGSRGIVLLFNLDTRRDGWLTPLPGRFREKGPVLNVWEAGWVPGPDWTVRIHPVQTETAVEVETCQFLYVRNLEKVKFPRYSPKKALGDPEN